MKLTQALIPVLALTALASGCASTNSGGAYDQVNVRSAADRSYGVIESIESGRASDDSALLGTVIGGAVGAAVGHEVGDGRSNDVATVAGAVGGAVVGRKIDKAHDRKNNEDSYLISVRLDDGSRQSITQESLGDLRIGDSVRIDNGRVRRL
jgi:outer membrane lipoprotein SlyB